MSKTHSFQSLTMFPREPTVLPSFRQLDLHLQHVEVLLSLDVHLDVLRIDLDVLADDVDQLALQRREVAGLAPAADALVREDDLQPLLCDLGAALPLAEQERQE